MNFLLTESGRLIPLRELRIDSYLPVTTHFAVEQQKEHEIQAMMEMRVENDLGLCPICMVRQITNPRRDHCNECIGGYHVRSNQDRN